VLQVKSPSKKLIRNLNKSLNNQLRNKSGIITALIFFFVNVVFSQSLPTGQAGSYPINDPRNPDCPCHKYQKLADEEYKQLLAGNKILEKEKNIIINENKKTNKNHNPVNQNKLIALNPEDKTIHKLPISNEDGINTLGEIKEELRDIIVSEQKINRPESLSNATHHKTTKHWKGKRKKHSAHYKQLKRIFDVSGWDIWKSKRITSACYHWR